MGELHLDVMVDRLKTEFSIKANVGSPQVAYRETIVDPVEINEILDRQLGNQKQFAGITLRLENIGDGSYENKFENSLKDDKYPAHLIPLIKQSLLESLSSGAIAGFPVIAVKIHLLDFKYEDNNFDEVSFQIVCAMAIRNALFKAKSLLQEPVMKLEVLVPEEYTSNIMTDLNTRRAKVNQIYYKGQLQVIDANVPLSEMFGYSTKLRSLSQGRATSTMFLIHMKRFLLRL